MRWREVRTAGADELEVALEPEDEAVRVLAPLDEAGVGRVAAAIAGRPGTALWLEDGREDLAVLAAFPGLRRLRVHSLRLRSLDGLAATADLVELVLGNTLRPISLRPVSVLSGLRRLAVNGTWRDVDTVGRLTRLRALGVGAVDVEWLLPLLELEELESGLGRIANFERLPEVGRLRVVELYRVRELREVSALGRTRTLRHLRLESMSKVTGLPSFRDCPVLRRIDLDTMTGITDLQPVADAPALRYLLLVGMRQLDSEHLRPLVGHPSLRAGIWGFGSDRKNRDAQRVLPLPPRAGGWTGDPPWLSDDLST